MDDIRFVCHNCEQDVSNTIIISCLVCKKIDLCPECFSSGAEFGTHLRSHDYSVYVCNPKPVYQKGWSVEEEMLLLEGIEKKGFGNWSSIATYIGTKTDEQVEEHYLDVYLDSEKSPLPDVNHIVPKKGKSKKKRNKLLYSRYYQNKNQSSNDVVPRSNPKEETESYNKKQSTFAYIAGYMPKRNDFEVEYDNECEKITENMGFEDYGVPWELKYKVLQGYMDRISERIRKKNFVISRELIYPKSYNLLNQKTKQKKKPKKNENKVVLKKEKEFQRKMKVFTRCFENKKDYEAVCQSLFDEQKVKMAIEKLKDWRQNGITSIAEGQDFELEKKSVLNASKKRRRTSHRKKLSSKSRRKLPKDSSSSSVSPSSTEVARTVLPGRQLLSEEEIKIAQQLEMIPQQYLAIKNQFLITEQVNTSTDLDQQKLDKISNFYRKNSWL
ncbi:transcriptional adapter 2-alpha [Anaeramoeba flamelloides]|uniref:Transcriptional adapter 2-alpha n=1 Tax=Anaeramoeba flamelloides TaxID=1746091 RepID=A0ABQ8XZL1_9EUKA|nr:transcriptional adapter 2-alpha [Anaeramoeba flamelloides]